MRLQEPERCCQGPDRGWLGFACTGTWRFQGAGRQAPGLPQCPGASEDAHYLHALDIAGARRAPGPMNLHRLDLVSLSLFTLVVRTGSISKGAEFGVDLFSLSKVMVGNRALA